MDGYLEFWNDKCSRILRIWPIPDPAKRSGDDDPSIEIWTASPWNGRVFLSDAYHHYLSIYSDDFRRYLDIRCLQQREPLD